MRPSLTSYELVFPFGFKGIRTQILSPLKEVFIVPKQLNNSRTNITPGPFGCMGLIDLCGEVLSDGQNFHFIIVWLICKWI